MVRGDSHADVEYRPTTCAVCSSGDYKPLFSIPPRQIVECKNCGHEYVNPISITPTMSDYLFPSSEEDALNTEIEMSYLKRIFKKYNLVNCRLLDLGCGQGRLEQGLIRAGWDQKNLYLMDTSESALDFAQKIYKSAHILLGDAEGGIGFDDYFYCVLMLEVLEDLVNPRKVMENALGALKTGGLVIIRGLPNNKSLEAFIGQAGWKMRTFERHYQFFNPETFSLFAESFPDAEILEFGCFLQEGYRFYDILRIAKDIGVIGGHQGHGRVPQTDELTELVLDKLRSTDFDDYAHRERAPLQKLAAFSTTREVEEFFDGAHLDYLLSPDFSVVLRKVKGAD